ncbi:MAG: hypothetical protein II920_05710 [Clostridia bacterium]|nr:hypothetical protein [Clostridia bacterium]
MDTALLNSANSLLENVTPLRDDCGQYCDRACCRDNGEAGSCVWLLPGEDANAMEWAQSHEALMPVTKTKCAGVYCLSPCDRALRPFMCRIFPLSPYFSEKKNSWSVRMDRRAAALCPLFSYGKKGLRSEFVSACEQAVQLLASDADYLSCLEALEAEEAAYRMEL